MFNSSRPYTFDRVVRIIISVICVIALYWLLRTLSGALLPFGVACLLAYIFEPFVAWNKKVLHCRRNIIPIFVFLLEFVGLITLLGWLLIPRIAEELVVIGQLLGNYTSEINDNYMPQAVHDFIANYVDIKEIASKLSSEQWTELIKDSLSGTWLMVSGSISVMITICSWFIVLLYFIFILLDYNRFMQSMRNLIPKKYKDTILKIGGDIKNSMNRYFRGQTLVAFIVGVLFCIGFYIIGLPMAIIMGMFIGVLNLVPYLQLISIPPVILLCVVYAAQTDTNFWVIFGLTMLVYAVVQVIQDLYLVPKIMGKAMGLNPAIILLSLTIWGSLLGFLGLIIALPLTTLLLSYYNKYVLHKDNDRVEEKEVSENDQNATKE